MQLVDTLVFLFNRVVSFIIRVIALLLLLRLVFFMVGAADIGIVAWVNMLTSPLVEPFRHVSLSSPIAFLSSLDVASLGALIIWILIIYFVVSLLAMFL